MSNNVILTTQERALIFNSIYENNYWGDPESVSGNGSTILATETLRFALQNAFGQLSIRSVLDVPCGDFNWFRHLDLRFIKYTGMDIVEGLIERNRAIEGEIEGRCFIVGDLISTPLPAADLLFCRDCLVHLPFSSIFDALRNIANSRFQYVAFTTFKDRMTNFDTNLGNWRPINLEIPPFSLPQPFLEIHEDCKECEGFFNDKTIGIWHKNQLNELIATFQHDF